MDGGNMNSGSSNRGGDVDGGDSSNLRDFYIRMMQEGVQATGLKNLNLDTPEGLAICAEVLEKGVAVGELRRQEENQKDEEEEKKEKGKQIEERKLKLFEAQPCAKPGQCKD
ncbi:unnamed protein product [Calypogeia fissa]